MSHPQAELGAALANTESEIVAFQMYLAAMCKRVCHACSCVSDVFTVLVTEESLRRPRKFTVCWRHVPH